jgi:crotonobetainyl-CoA:carnitine CoA-transferase CaiB-like acyl-CoA transferase
MATRTPHPPPPARFRPGGLLNIAANKDEQWERLARHLGLEALLDRADYATREDRKSNRLLLKAELENGAENPRRP